MSSSPVPRPYIVGPHPQSGVLYQAGGHAEPHALVADARNLEATNLVNQALAAQAKRPAELRDRELIDLCLDLRNTLTSRAAA